MPLPEPGTAWPPVPHSLAWSQASIHDAWWTGDTDRLASSYGSYTEQSSQPVIRPSQWRGGLVGTLARWFWGAPAPSSDYPVRVHVPLASDIATASARLLFGRPPTVLPPEGASAAAAARIDDTLNGPAIHSTLAEAAESQAALGGVVLRVAWDGALSDRPILDSVDCDHAIPEYAWGHLQRVTIVTTLPDPTGEQRSSVRWRHLECHELVEGRAVIRHGLYEGNHTGLGRRAAYEEHPATQWLALEATEGRLVEDTIDTGATMLTAAYIPNLRPQRKWRHHPQLRPLGRSDLDGIEPTLDRLDETISSLIRDIGLAKARAIIPEWMLADLGPGKGSALDMERALYSPVAGDPRDKAAGAAAEITVMQPAIRVAEHLDTATALTVTAIRAAGYSPLTFGLSDEVAQTATEITARERASLGTMETKRRYWTAAAEDVLTAYHQVDTAQYGAAPIADRVRIEWPPAATDPLQVRAQTVELLHRAEAASTRERVAIVHPDWDEERIDDEVAEIEASAPDPLPDPMVAVPPAAQPDPVPPEPAPPGE